jgi:hypothetical protein
MLQINLLRQTRENFNKLVRAFSLEQLNQIPEGFSNNLIWNFGHAIITQHLLTYGLAGLDMDLDEELLGRLRKGSKLDEEFTESDLEYLLELSSSSLDRLEQDLDSGEFEFPNPYPTSYGFTINKIEDALEFDIAHEALHFGYAMAIRKALK